MSNETLFDKAKQNLNIAKTIYSSFSSDEAYLNYAAYHIQQALELSIKYLLEMNGVVYPKTHDIDQLIQLADQKGVDLYISEYIYDHSEMFSLWEARTRYILNYRVENKKIQRALAETEIYINELDRLTTPELEYDEPEL